MADESYQALLPVKSASTEAAEIKPLNEGDREVMEALREVLLKHNATDRFGITLIHSHFATDDDETLLETSDSANRTMTIRPHKGRLPDGTIETAWRFAKTRLGPIGMLGCRGEWYWDHSTNPPTYRYRHWAS
jgi:hypothetical protein